VKAIGALIEGIAGRAGLKNIREVGESLTKADRGHDVGSDVLDYGQLVITGLKNTTGQGDPDRGDVFGDGLATFHGVNETLKSAAPDDGWDGSGSHAYADQNTRQQLRSEAMADADRAVHTVLCREAAQITLRRGYLDDQHNFLANTSYVTLSLQFIPRHGEAMKLAIEIAALQTALGESYHQLNQLQREVAQNAAALQQTVGRYSGVGDDAELPSAALCFDPLTQRRSTKWHRGDERPSDGETDLTMATAGESESEGAPVGPVAASLDSDNPPGPPAGTPPQSRR
jgi:hypothetical protein